MGGLEEPIVTQRGHWPYGGSIVMVHCKVWDLSHIDCVCNWCGVYRQMSSLTDRHQTRLSGEFSRLFYKETPWLTSVTEKRFSKSKYLKFILVGLIDL